MTDACAKVVAGPLNYKLKSKCDVCALIEFRKQETVLLPLLEPFKTQLR